MAISLRTAGAWAVSNATTQTVTLPTHQAGDMLIVRTVRKPFTSPDNTVINTAGWAAVATGVANGSTANGVGVGSMGFKAFWKIAASGSETNPVVTWGTTAAPGAAVAMAYQKGGSESWVTPAGNGGGDATARTSQTSTIASHISVTSGDLVDFFRGQCDDSGALTVPTITQTGVTYNTVTESPATALLDGTSNDIAADGGYRIATAGTSSAAAVVTGTSAASEQHGAWMTRLRVSTTQDYTPALLSQTAATFAPTVTRAGDPIVYAQDTFTRSVSPGFGTADIGGAYTHSSTTSVSVDGSKGVIAVTSSRAIYLGDVSQEDVDVTAKFRLAATLVDGIIGLIVRVQGTTTFYRLGLDPEVTGLSRIQIHKFVSGTATELGSSVDGPVLNTDGSDSWWLRVQAEGTSPTTLRIKAWKDGDSEPGTWGMEETDSEGVLQAAGGVGFRTNLGASPGHIDDLNATDIAAGGSPQSYTPSLINQAAATFAPTITKLNTFTPALINQTAATFAPTRTSLNTYTPALINQTAVPHAPTITKLNAYSPGLISQAAATFAPTVAQSSAIVLGLIDRTASTAPSQLLDIQAELDVTIPPLALARVFVHYDTSIESGYSVELGDDEGGLDLVRVFRHSAGSPTLLVEGSRGLPIDDDWVMQVAAFGSEARQVIRWRTWRPGTDAVPWWSEIIDTSASILVYEEPPTFELLGGATDNDFDYAAPLAADHIGVTNLNTYTPALISQAATTFNPTISVGAAPVSVGLISQTAATFTPTVSSVRNLTLGLISQTASPFTPTVTALNTYSPALISQTAATFAPTVTTSANIAPALINQAASPFAPTISVGAAPITIGLLSQPAATFTPTVLQQRFYTPALLSNPAATFTPTVSTTNAISVALIDRTAVPHAPTVTTANAISFGLINQAAATFSPTVSAGAVTYTPALLNQTAVAHAPVVSAPVAIGFITQTAVAFAPTVIQQQFVSLALINQAAATFAPTISTANAIVLALISQAAVPFAPTITTGAVDISLALIDRTAATNSPSVTTSNVIELNHIDQTATTFAPVAIIDQEISLDLLDQTAVAEEHVVTNGNAVVPDTIDQTAETFAPTVSATSAISLDLIDEAADTFTPTISSGEAALSVGLIDHTAATFTPTITTGVATVALGLIDQSASASTPGVANVSSISLDRIEQGAATFAPAVSSVRTVSFGLIDSTAQAFAPSAATAGDQDVLLDLLSQPAMAFAPEVSTGTHNVGAGGSWRGFVLVEEKRVPQEQFLELAVIATNVKAYAPVVVASEDEALMGLSDEDLLVLV